MEIKFKPVTMNCIQFHNNYKEVVEFIKNEYGDEFGLNFQQHDPRGNFGKDYMSVDFDKGDCIETYYIEDRDYVVCLPTRELLSAYNEAQFKQMFERC